MSNAVPLRGEADKEIGANFAPLLVSAQDIPSLTVKIRAGSFWNADGVVVEFPGGNSPTIPAPASLNRWSLLSLSATGSVTITHGTSLAAPSIPAPPAGSLPLAAIYMTAATTQITNASIQDVRPMYAVVETVPNLAAELATRPTFTDVANDLTLKADVDGTPNSIFALSKGAVGPANAQLSVIRGASPTVSIRWNDTTDTWQFTNDGSTFADIASVSGVFMNLVSGPVAGNVLTTDGVGQALNSGTALSALATTANIATKLDDFVGVNGNVVIVAGAGTALADGGIALSAMATDAELTAGLALKASLTGATFTGNVVIDTVATNAMTLGNVGGPADSGITIDRGVDPAALFYFDEVSDSWTIGVTGNVATVAVGNLASKVSLTGNETIAGIKTFTSAPVLPSFTIAGLPVAPAVGSMALATNANSGNGAIVYFANGIWRDVGTNVAPVL